MLNGDGRRRLYLILAAVTAIGVMAAIGVALAATSPPTEKQYEEGVRAEVASAPSAAQQQALGIMRRSQTSSDAMPPELTAQLTANERFTGMQGANVALARRAGGAPGAAWVIPGTGIVCLAAFASPSATEGPGQLGVAGCQQEASAEDGTMYVESAGASAPGKAFVAGIVPDGVSAVTLDLASGSSVQAQVHENVYMDEVEGEATDLRFSGPSGPVTVGGLRMYQGKTTPQATG
jgi:hypothetical protein